MPIVYDLVPDFDIPSWGIGMLYSNVKLLNKNGIQATVVHHKQPFKCSWFQSDAPSLVIKKEDIPIVPEVNTAGCIPVSYEAYGGKDDLEDGKNAYVFPNNYIYQPADRLFELIDTSGEVQDELSAIRANGYETASHYGDEVLEGSLLLFYKPLSV